MMTADELAKELLGDAAFLAIGVQRHILYKAAHARSDHDECRALQEEHARWIGAEVEQRLGRRPSQEEWDRMGELIAPEWDALAREVGEQP